MKTGIFIKSETRELIADFKLKGKLNVFGLVTRFLFVLIFLKWTGCQTIENYVNVINNLVTMYQNMRCRIF